MRRIYLDHGATTPVHPEVIKSMTECMENFFGNPSSVHSFGRDAKKLLEDARQNVAALIGARAEEIIFTSGGTEADNMAITGVARALRKKGNHIITSAIEHHAVLDTCKALEKEGFEITVLPVDEYGLIRLADLEKAIKDTTVLITIMQVNNEVGSIQPIKDIVALAKPRGILVHTDGVQSVGKIPVDVNDLGIDLLSISAHKIYGPKGVGCLYIRKGTKMHPLFHGGGQERRRRSGTENMPGIVGLGSAAKLMLEKLDEEQARLISLRDRLIKGLLDIPHTKLNGHPTLRAPHNVNVSFEYIEGESLLLSLDMKGIAASSGSACTSGSLDPSHCLLAMGIDHATAHGSLRLTLGLSTTEEDIDYVVDTIYPIVERLRAMSPLYNK